MRGYEVPAPSQLAEHFYRYESPCGVMRTLIGQFRILAGQVTNPHAGL